MSSMNTRTMFGRSVIARGVVIVVASPRRIAIQPTRQAIDFPTVRRGVLVVNALRVPEGVQSAAPESQRRRRFGFLTVGLAGRPFLTGARPLLGSDRHN